MGDHSAQRGLLSGLSELAVRVQRARTLPDVLRVAGDGLVGLGMHLIVYQVDDAALVLRFVATTPERQDALERAIHRPLVGLRAPLARCGPLKDCLEQRGLVRADVRVFSQFVEAASKHKLPLSPMAVGASNGVLAPLFVGERPWGILSVAASLPLAGEGLSSRAVVNPDESEAIAVLAAQVASAIEVAELTQALHRTREELVAHERLTTIGELAATVAHEVRNPLGVLLNSVASLRRLLPPEVDPAKRSDADVVLSIVAEETARLNEIVTDLLELARPWIMRTGEASLRSIVRAVVDDVPRVSGGTAKVHLDLVDLPPVDLDARTIGQALLTLVMCAVQSTPQGTIRVETRMEHGDDVSFACVDVVAERRGAQRASTPRNVAVSTTRPAGTGLELALVRRVVEAHRGELEVVADEHGTILTMRIPIPQWDDSHVALKRQTVPPTTLRAGTGR